MIISCSDCNAQVGTLHYSEGSWVCSFCYERPPQRSCQLFEYGVENPVDPKGSTAHVRDIKSRRLDKESGKIYRYTGSKSYFY